jgi:hypothetical protein
MQVWVRQDGKSREPNAEDPGWSGLLYRPMDPATLGPSEPPQPSDLLSPSASHCWQRDSVGALLDGREPKNSHDESLPRFTWWDRRGTSEWVQCDAEQPITVSAVSVYWFDDRPQGGCRVPASWKVLYLKDNEWQEVTNASDYGTALDQYNRTTFEPVTTTGLRVSVQLAPESSGGILEWKWESH